MQKKYIKKKKSREVEHVSARTTTCHFSTEPTIHMWYNITNIIFIWNLEGVVVPMGLQGDLPLIIRQESHRKLGYFCLCPSTTNNVW